MRKTIKATMLCIFTLTIIVSGQDNTFPIVGTAVTDFYDESGITSEPQAGEPFYGQDAHYQKNIPSYTNNNNGTITDDITGLMWQSNMGEKITFDQAKTKADTLSSGGHTDWRVPTLKELYSLILFTGRASGQEVIDKFIDTTVFDQPIGDPRPIDAQTWSSNEYVGTTMNADATVFGVNFLDGRIKGYPKFKPGTGGQTPNAMYFRMVRGVATYGINDFVDNSDETITDRATGLMWQQVDDGTSRDWEEALEYAEKLELAGHTDWRLPSSKELQGIVDYTRAPDITNSPAIDPLFTCTEINDPDGNPGQYPYYWSGTTHLDGPNPGGAAAYVAFGEAQGKMNDKLMDVHGAGAQRSDPKSGNASDYPQFFGPQGDVRYVYNYVRCVRYAEETEIEKAENNILQENNCIILCNTDAHNKFSLTLSVKQSGNVAVNIYTVNGQHSTTLENSFKSAGNYRYQWQTDNQSNGIYVCIVTIGNQTENRIISFIRN